MWRWGISFSRAVALAAAAVVAAAPVARAGVYLTVDEALELAFPGCRIERQTVYLTDAQLAEARRLAGVEIAGGVVRPYRARCENPGEEGTAYFDSHRVRTLPETLMVVVDPRGRVRRIEVLAFREPEEYLPRPVWYGQFPGRGLDDELALDRGVRGVIGATLTARATTQAVRRVLALDRVIAGEAAAAGSAAGAAAPPAADPAAGRPAAPDPGSGR